MSDQNSFVSTGVEITPTMTTVSHEAVQPVDTPVENPVLSTPALSSLPVLSPEESRRAGGVSRVRTKVDFSYFDLDNSIKIVLAIEALGGNQVSWAEVARQMNMDSASGGFRIRMLSAKTFGLIAYDQGLVSLTDLGQRVTQPATALTARIHAFSTVVLFNTLFRQLQGQPLPSDADIEARIEALGVSPKQKSKARQIFLRAAEQAGLLGTSREALSLPASFGAAELPLPVAKKRAPRTRSQTPRESRKGKTAWWTNIHPFVKALVEKLPAADTPWPVAERQKWLESAANVLGLVYTSTSMPTPGEGGETNKSI
jgi:hypothetical protein